MQNLYSIHPWTLVPSSTKTPGAFWVAAGQSVGLKPRRASTNPHKLEDQFAQLVARRVKRMDALNDLPHVNCGSPSGTSLSSQKNYYF